MDEFDAPVANARKQAKKPELKKAGIDNIFWDVCCKK
jgi:hypothetical protein